VKREGERKLREREVGRDRKEEGESCLLVEA